MALPAPNPQVSANALTAFAYFISKGLSPAQSAGVVGNLIQESGVNPNVGNGMGIAQWTPPGNLYAYAAKVGQPANSLKTQLDFLWQDMQGGPVAAIKQTTTPGAAAVSFMNTYERCLYSNTPDEMNRAGGCMGSNRVANANSVFSAGTGLNAPVYLASTLGGTATPGQDPSSGSNSDCVIGWDWPNIGPVGGGHVCIWHEGWSRAALGGLLIAAGGVLLITGVIAAVGGGAFSSINKVAGGGAALGGAAKMAGIARGIVPV